MSSLDPTFGSNLTSSQATQFAGLTLILVDPRDSQDPHYLVPHYPFRPKYRRNMASIVVGYQVVGVQGASRSGGVGLYTLGFGVQCFGLSAWAWV